MHTERLFIRPFTVDDAEEFMPLASHPDILRFTGERPLESLDDVRQTLLNRSLRDYTVHGFGRMACIEKESGRLVGFSGLKYLEDLKEVDVGYRFLPDCWGKGYATESALALMHHGVREHNLKRIIGLVEPANNASVHVLKKLGLKFEQKIKPEGCVGDMDMYAIAILSR
ncbi:GNAT family N-acetyltransferase [Undibacterium sp. RuTC16W]|uniref:GNAT family N-acetyltransferase n=1 Tax=Undibacterium sp. RuTC16W TaxID=3413048 RepID=UPI003BEF50BB